MEENKPEDQARQSRVWDGEEIGTSGPGSGWDRSEDLARWDSEHPKGEGKLAKGVRFYWIKITDGNKHLCNVAFTADGSGVQTMYIDQTRKGKFPNPFFQVGVARVLWERLPGALLEDLRSQIDGKDVRARTNTGDSDAVVSRNELADAQSGVTASQHEPGVRPVTGAHIEAARDSDHRFHFGKGAGHLVVRGSRLAPVLLGLRKAGQYSVSVDLLRKAIAP
ncbi:hypothetical protein ACTXMG_05225 [Corynebacterium flavescens]|uniref:hypothetical protein n=1 Tax=Corynebacterium flavescens TaxID=28028 RepID=UPI003FD41A45